MSTRYFVGTLLVHAPLKLHLFFSVMNNSSNAFSHQLMTTWCIGLLWNHPHYELNSSSAAQDVVRICRKNWASYEDGKDWRFYHGCQTKEERWMRRWLWRWETLVMGPVRSRCSINCASVFAKIDILLPPKLADQHLLDSRLVAPTSTNCMQLPWYNSNKMWISWWVPRPFQLNRCKTFKNWAKFVKDDVIDHFIARTSSEWRVIGMAWQNTDIARGDDLRKG
jgi:hypothetical protein